MSGSLPLVNKYVCACVCVWQTELITHLAPGGREFQARRQATTNARSPTMRRRVARTNTYGYHVVQSSAVVESNAGY